MTEELQTLNLEWTFRADQLSRLHWAAVEMGCPIRDVFRKGLILILATVETMAEHPGARLALLDADDTILREVTGILAEAVVDDDGEDV